MSIEEEDGSRLPPPTVGEIGRTLLALQRDYASLRFDMAQTYVRQDVWQRAEESAGIRVGELSRDFSELKAAVQAESFERRKDIDKIIGQRDADRRLIFTALLAPLISGILVALIVSSLI